MADFSSFQSVTPALSDTIVGYRTATPGGELQTTVSGLKIAISTPLYVSFNAGNSVNTWAIGTGATTAFASSTAGGIAFSYLAGFTGLEFTYHKGSTAGTSTSGAVYIGYSTAFTTNAALYANITSDNSQLPINATNTWVNSGSHPIISVGNSGVFLAVVGSGGDGSALGFGRFEAIFR